VDETSALAEVKPSVDAGGMEEDFFECIVSSSSSLLLDDESVSLPVELSSLSDVVPSFSCLNGIFFHSIFTSPFHLCFLIVADRMSPNADRIAPRYAVAV